MPDVGIALSAVVPCAAVAYAVDAVVAADSSPRLARDVVMLPRSERLFTAARPSDVAGTPSAARANAAVVAPVPPSAIGTIVVPVIYPPAARMLVESVTSASASTPSSLVSSAVVNDAVVASRTALCA